ncbi:MAG: MBL fold metallo-hydrolase [Anaerolineae bacterium]|jgi:glyoxylase-like metal-dependent hydrolase (beta-lactamase superfamily II)
MIRVKRVTDAPQVIKLHLARTLLGKAFYFTAAYWVDGLLVDTGCAHTAPQFSATLKDLHVGQVVNTHSHEDHIGANAAVGDLFGCQVLAHPDALPILQDPKLQPLQPYRRLFWGWPQPSHGAPVNEWVETENYCFQVIHTPGHSPDHICLFEPERGWLFSGDAYIGGQDRALRQGYDIHGIIASLKKLAELPVQMIFSGSGTVRTDGTKHLKDKIAYLEELGERIRDLADQGLSARRIRRQVLGRELPITYLTLGHFSGLRLVQSYLAEASLPELTEEPTGEAHEKNPDEPAISD